MPKHLRVIPNHQTLGTHKRSLWVTKVFLTEAQLRIKETKT